MAVIVEIPSATPAKGGLLAVASVVDTDDGHIAQGVEFEVDACGVAHLAPGLCFQDPNVPVDAEKAFDPRQWVESVPFPVYKGIECGLHDVPRNRELARNGLVYGEGHAVEQAAQAAVLNPNALRIGSGAVSPQEAVGALEAFAGDNYGGVPILHTTRYGAAILGASDLIDRYGSALETVQGTPVANGSGYGPEGPAGEIATPGQFWVYVTGRVFLRRTPIRVTDAYAVEVNVSRVLAERIYAAAVECIVGAVLVDASLSDGGGGVVAWDDITGKPALVETVNGEAPDAGGNVALSAADVGAAPTDHTHPVADIEATGTADATTFLRGDGTWNAGV